jgi:hypothetical protein
MKQQQLQDNYKTILFGFSSVEIELTTSALPEKKEN